MHDYSITFATLNCLEFTKKCIDSLVLSGADPEKIIVVDNASTDGTQKYLQQLEIGDVILNKQNLSCGAAWNQGILSRQSEWTIVMNNDIIVAPNFVERLINFANENQLLLVSPARIDGELDYDFASFSTNAQLKLKNAIRWRSSNAICMCIHWSLFNKIGFFRSDPNLLGFEDGLFYNEVRKNNINHATTGQCWIHHFGGVTQIDLKKELGKKDDELLVKVNDRKIYCQSWFDRKLYRYQLIKNHKSFRKEELLKYEMTLHGVRINKSFNWV
jgi:N-acetylglucosaminyl-diphospho-decaprenol L-rhamnosyltransferase